MTKLKFRRLKWQNSNLENWNDKRWNLEVCFTFWPKKLIGLKAKILGFQNLPKSILAEAASWRGKVESLSRPLPDKSKLPRNLSSPSQSLFPFSWSLFLSWSLPFLISQFLSFPFLVSHSLFFPSFFSINRGSRVWGWGNFWYSGARGTKPFPWVLFFFFNPK